MMSRSDFNTRIDRIAKGASANVTKGPGSRRPNRAGLGIISFLAFLLGFCGLVLLQVATEDGFGPDWVYYRQVVWYVAAYHILIIPAVLLSILKFRSWPALRKVTVASLLGYVVALILMALKGSTHGAVMSNDMTWHDHRLLPPDGAQSGLAVFQTAAGADMPPRLWRKRRPIIPGEIRHGV